KDVLPVIQKLPNSRVKGGLAMVRDDPVR
ncbi:hypothetical protein PybrP1_009765, partial [[Pythium] brassicae (nom. inval.)]